MTRVKVLVEGQTEETFVRDVISDHLARKGIFAVARCVETGRKGNKIFRGGMTTYSKMKRELEYWMREDAGAYYTTMFDFYQLPEDFPGYSVLEKFQSPYEKVAHLEKSFLADISLSRRFIPYIQLHEFEALLLADPQKFAIYFDCDREIAALDKLCTEFASPELINQGVETAPSKRIIKEITSYGNLKAVAGPIIAQAIGLPMLRAKCQHFDEWLSKLESLVD